MGTFGERLRREREARNITLEEIAESTKISRRSLQALEQEDFSRLPGGVFNRGFVRSYARHIGIDEDQAVSEYNTANKAQSPAEEIAPVVVEQESAPPLNPRRSYLPLLASVAALTGVLAVYSYSTRHKSPVQADSTKTPAVTHTATKKAMQPVEQEKSQSAPLAAVATASEPAKRTANTRKSAVMDSVLPKAVATVSATVADTSQQPEVSQSDRPVRVVVGAREDSWVSLIADGRTVMEGVLSAGA
ncbi:MAG TPA: helix-turn-helix domain-containing protein, partial [Alphaproteobacteria bacterium]|nr:helix-turn-helix domain-containing protein [Alphaproteobacteria bacterium]